MTPANLIAGIVTERCAAPRPSRRPACRAQLSPCFGCRGTILPAADGTFDVAGFVAATSTRYVSPK